MTEGRMIDMATADDSTVVDTFDLMETFGVSRETIRVRMRKGVLPPALDRSGKRLRWTVGYLKEWDRLRTQKAIESLANKKSIRIAKCIGSSEFG